MRKKGCYHKNRPFRLLVAAALRFVQSYLNDIAHRGSISKPASCLLKKLRFPASALTSHGRCRKARRKRWRISWRRWCKNKRENRRKSYDFHRFGGASGRTWTGDLLITKSRKDIKITISGRFQHFLLGNQCSLPLLFPLFPSAPFAVWVSVWVKPENPAQKLRRSNQRWNPFVGWT